MNKIRPVQQPVEMKLTAMDVVEEKRDELKRSLGETFPEVFAEGTYATRHQAGISIE